MDVVTALFDAALLIFTVPVLAAVALWVSALIGLFDFEAFDLDLEAPDAGLDAGLDAEVGADGIVGSGVLQALGVGMIPFSLLLTLTLFVFGWAGITLHGLFGEALGWGGLGLNMLFVPLSLVVALAATAGASRLLRPLFRDYGRPPGAHDLVGKLAVVSSGTVTPTFGSAVVRLGGDRIEVATRSLPDQPELAYGAQVVLVEYDAEHNLYFVGAFEDETPALLSP